MNGAGRGIEGEGSCFSRTLQKPLHRVRTNSHSGSLITDHRLLITCFASFISLGQRLIMSMRMPVILSFAVLVLRAVADGPADNVADKVRPIPPPGIALGDADRSELTEGVA